jgi:hypothetical protein
MDGPIRCSSLTLEREERLKIRLSTRLFFLVPALMGDDHHHNALRDFGLMACSDLIFTNPIVFSVDVSGLFSLMVGSSG